MTDKKAPDMPWPFVRRCAECFPTDFYAYYQGRNYCEFGHEKFSTGYWIQESEARELLDMRAERDRLREALEVAKEALGKCRDLPMPLFIDGVMVATEALARIEEIVK